jgi:2-aminoethylphosphonate aminotransferase|tara:strand:+ start:208 stop:1338 length:1131 start_codon:yes stop_codon:yes gene_type:complete
MNRDIERKILLNPGPATTTDTVKMAQIVPDICPRENDFKELMASIRTDLLKIINAKDDEYVTVLFGGSGTSVMESSISSVVDYNKSLLIIINGAYGKRMEDIAKSYSIDYISLEYKWGEPISFDEVEKNINENSKIGYMAMVHHETTTGILNSIKKFSELGKKYNKKLIIDTISSYAGIDIDINNTPVDYLMSTSNKCIQGMPGIGFLICNKKEIIKLKNIKPRCFYLSLYDEYSHIKKTGESRFTPPVQVIYALRHAIDEMFAEGLLNRYQRYQDNMNLLRSGLKELGFRFLLEKENESGILVSIKEPTVSSYSFEKMHDYLYENGITIYPGKLINNNTFRLAIIGDLQKKDIQKVIMKLKYYLNRLAPLGNIYS